MTQIHDLPAHRLLAMVRSRELSPTEITEHFLDRTERYDHLVGAYITVTPEKALEQARYAQKRVMADTPETLPPLLGLPVPVKDLDPVAGVRLTHGSPVFRDAVAPTDSGLVARLRAAGAVLPGKTNTPEFGSSCYTENAVAPPSRNPWNTDLSPGGSSGGAAAAVAAGLAPVAQGSDGGGSIRIPASACGLFGLKPTRGRISGAPLKPDLAGLSTAGPLTRGVRDAALLLDAMAFSGPGDHFTAPPLPPGETFADHVGREPGRLRIGCHATTGSARIPVHPHVLAAHEEAVRLLTDLGHEVEEVPAPGDAHFGGSFMEDFGVVWAAMASATPVAPAREAELSPLNQWLRERARATPVPDYIAACARLQRGVRSLVAATEPLDAVLSPVLAAPPVPLGHFTGDGPEEEFRRMTAFAPFTSVYNVSGQPSVSVPLHWSPEGLPIGVMLTGRMGGEGTLLSLSAQLERARPWGHRVPPLRTGRPDTSPV
ncbi:amidase [Nocardiopsis dassonvillei]|uniref:amidase n=1 Tax=Nocardiopsis dassonvillei TaxID=2014 RepID=UPI000B9D62FD|nr:amidase [Nocardiopsis dassonvillei]ASU59817.1 amidase [Nocardiopsis dassonvillei]